MDKNNQQIPGFGFDPGYEPSPFPQQPAPSNNSIFGVISKVNKGILKHPPNQTPETEAEKELQSNIQQARAVAKKLSNLSPQDAKQRIFLNAKNTIENIQKGIWNSPASQANRQALSNTGFKVPAAISAPKLTASTNRGQGQSMGTKQDEGQKFNIPNQQMSSRGFEEENKQSVFEELDRSKQISSFTRKEALDEIDRYRGTTSNTNRDQTYEDMNKKSEPFKSDFDRYYYGDETQRSEISGRLHRTDNSTGYDPGNDFDSKPFHVKSERQDSSLERSYSSSSRVNSRLNDDYQAGINDSERMEHDSYEGNGNYGTDDTSKYGRYHNETYKQDDEKYYQRKSSRAEGKDYEVESESVRRSEYDPERWHYSGCVPNDDKGHDSRRISSGYSDDRWENKKSQHEEDTSYGNNYDPYMKDNKNRMTRADNTDYNSRQRESQERYVSGGIESRERYSQSPKVFDYDHTTRSYDREVDSSYQARRNDNEYEGRFDNRSGQMNREMRGSRVDRSRDTGYRDRESDRDRYYEERGHQYYNEGERDTFYDDVNYREREERFDARSDEYNHYGDEMANMEEFPEETEQGESKSQDGGMLYEDFLFGDEEEDTDHRAVSRGRDDKGYRGRQYDSDYNRKPGYEDRSKGRQHDYTRPRDDSYDSFRSAGSDTREGRMKSSKGDHHGKESRERFDSRKEDHSFRKTESNLPITDDQKAQVKVGVVAGIPSTSNEPVKILPIRGGSTHGPPPSLPNNQATPPSRTGSQALPISGVPAPALAVIPPPGIICNDCNITCLSEETYKAHLTSDAHILTLQRKAQELFQMESRPSRFDVDSSGKPLKASVLPPTTMITGIPSNTLAKPSVGMQLGRNVFAGNPDVEIERRQDMVSRYRSSKSDSDVQVIPPKPLGPLQTRSVQSTWLILHWRTRHEDEEALIDKYVVEYRNAREIRWVRVGTTTKHEFEVNGLQEGTDYLFRVYTTNKDERSEYLESVLVTTKLRRDSSERSRRLPVRDRVRDSGRRSVRDQVRRSSRERDRKIGRESGRSSESRKSSGDRKLSRDADRSSTANRKSSSSRRKLTEKRSSRDTDSRENRQGKTRDSQDKQVKKTSSSSSKTNTATTSVDKEEEEAEKQTVESVEVEEKPDIIDVEADEPDEPVQEDVECLLYRELPNYNTEPMLGLDNIYEIRSYLPKTPPRYVCKLCNNKGSHKIIVKHIIGFPHKLNYFKKNNPEIFDVINVIALKKQQVERANYEARLEEDRIGRGSVRVMLMLNPEDNNGKTVYRDPIPVKAPAPLRTKETGEAPEVYDVSFQSQFDDLYNKAIETESISDTTLIGLDYVREILHPRMEKEPKYTCSLCSVMCHKTTILSHILGKKHRTNYLRVYHEEVYDMIVSSGDQKHQLTEKIKEFAEKDGTGTIRTKVARHERMWRDKSSKNEEAQEEMETQAQEEEGGNLEEPQQEVPDRPPEDESRTSSGVQAIKFGIKKTEVLPTNVKPINVLDQELAVPKHKEAFDWTKENDLLQSRIHNETIIKCSRKSKFLTVYSEFFKRYPVIGIQWVTEFQKQDVKQEPWYMCSMCQQKLQWKNILDHVTSNLHRLNYMKKSDYRQMYNAVYHAIKKDKQSARPLIEQYSKEISSIEGPPAQMGVMLELKINTEAFKSVAKVQENVKAHNAATSSSQPSSIQINIASTSLSSKKVSVEPASVAVEVVNDPKPLETSPSSSATLNTFPSNIAPNMNSGSQIQQQFIVQPPQTVQPQVPSLVQQQAPMVVHQQVQPPPLQAPLVRPPPLRPPPSATVPAIPYPPHNLQPGQVQRISMATAVPPQVQYQSTTSIPVPPLSGSMVQHQIAPPLGENAAAPGPHIQTMQSSYNSSVPAPTQQPFLPGPIPRPLFAATNPVQRPPTLPYPQVGQIPPVRPDQTPAPSSSLQQPANFPVCLSTQTSFANTPIMSNTSSVIPSTPQSFNNLPNRTPNLIGQRPPPWQKPSSTGPILSLPGSATQYASSVNIMTTNNVTNVNPSPQFSSGVQNKNSSDIVKTSDSNRLYQKETHLVDDRERLDKSNVTSDIKSDAEKMRYKNEYANDFDGRDTTAADSIDKDRGVKRYGRDARYSDRTKRLRNEDSRNDSTRRSPSFGRARDSDRRKNVNEEMDRRKDRDVERGNRDVERGNRDAERGNRDVERGNRDAERGSRDVERGIRDAERGSRDRRRSRSPYRSDRRSPPRNRQRDDNFRNRSNNLSRRSDRRPSPRRESDSYRRDRPSENHPDERRREQSFYRDERREQMPSDDFNEPLDEAKVDDLVKRYSGRVDDEYDHFMGKDPNWESMDDKFVGGRQRDHPNYESYDERYHDERQTYTNQFGSQEKFESNRDYNESWYDNNERSDNVYSGRVGIGSSKDTEFRDKSSRYEQYSRREYDLNRTNRGQALHENTDERRRGGQDVYLADRNRDRVNLQENFYSRDAVRNEEEMDPRHNEGWQYEEDNRNQRNFRQNQNEKQTYNMGAQYEGDAYDTRASGNMEVPGQRQGYGDDYGSMYEEPDVDDDNLPDPSREEIEALLRQANTVVPPSRSNFNDYRDDAPAVQTVRQGSNAGYSRGNRGRGGYRGRGGPRSGR